MTQDDLLTLAQRLREYNHNPHHINPVSDAFHRLITDSADALSQLAAIQGGAGDDVVVLATVSMGGVEYGIGGAELGDIDIQPDMKALCALQQSLVTGDDDAHVELIDKAQHQRIVDALSAQLRDANNLADQWAEKNAALAASTGQEV